MSDNSRDHIVAVPKAFNIIRYVQLVFSIIVLGLAAYGLSTVEGFGGQGFGIFVVMWTWVTLAYYLITYFYTPAGYNCWAILALECWAFIWWLSCWAWFAVWTAAYTLPVVHLNYKRDPRRGGSSSGGSSDIDNWTVSDAKTLRNVTAATAGIGALIWVLFITTLIMFSIAVHKHRRSGAPYRFGGTWRANSQGVVHEPSDKSAPPQAAPEQYQMYPQQQQQPHGQPQQYNYGQA